MTDKQTPPGPWVELFDSIADRYDESGVPWFRPIARVLVDLLDPRPGERFLELGPGRGAATVPLAHAVGPDGRVDALDLAPSMVRLLQEQLDAAGTTNVRLGVGDASDPRPPDAAYDGIAASLVLFFLPDPVATLTRWRGLARPGGRVGISTFPRPTGRLHELFDLVTEFAGPGPSPRGGASFDSDADVEAMFTAAGFTEVRTTTVEHVVPFEDVGQWRTWSMGTALRRIWTDTDPSRHPEALARAEEILGLGRDGQGRMSVEADIRYTLATA